MGGGEDGDGEDGGGAQELLGCCYSGGGLGVDGRRRGGRGGKVHGGVFPDCRAEFLLDVADAVLFCGSVYVLIVVDFVLGEG